MPDIRERLGEDLKVAMRAKTQLRLSTIRMIRSEIQYRDKEHGKETGEEDISKLIESMVKKSAEAAGLYTKGGREELATKEREAIRIIQDYLPPPIDDEALRQAIQAAIAETGASSMKEMGKVMGLLTKQLSGRAAASRISQVVKEMLGG